MDQNQDPMIAGQAQGAMYPRERPWWVYLLVAVPILLWWYVIGPFLRGFISQELWSMFGMTPPGKQ